MRPSVKQALLAAAGALDNPPAQIDGGKLSQTFAATMVHDEGLNYDVKPPDRQPA